MGGSAGSLIRVGSELLNFWDWSELGDKDISDLLSHVVELVGSSIGDDVSDISVDLVDVRNSVAEDFLEEGNWILEDGSPGLDSLDIWFHSSAVLEVIINGSDDLSNLGDTRDDVHNVFLLEILDGLNEINIDDLSILKAWLDLIEVVVLDESIEETSDELGDLVVGETNNETSGNEFGD